MTCYIIFILPIRKKMMGWPFCDLLTRRIIGHDGDIVVFIAYYTELISQMKL